MVLALGVAGVAGHVFGLEFLLRVSPTFVPVRPLTAVALVALGVTIVTFERSRHQRVGEMLWHSAMLVVLGVAVVSLAGLGDSEARPVFGSALTLALIASGYVLLRRGQALRRAGAGILVAAAFLPAITLNAYSLVTPEEIYGVGVVGEMAVHTALALVLACLAGLTADGERGIAGLLERTTAGARTARVVVPVLLLGPGVTTAIVHAGALAGWYPVTLERSLSVVLVTLAITLIFWLAAARFDSVDLRRAEAERLALTDPLTGLPNRRAFERALTTAQLAAERRGIPYAVVALDADELKAVNDAHGHDAGDRLIGAVAAALRDAMRPRDVAARVGGDEFLVLLPGIDADAAGQVTHRIVDQVNAHLRSAGPLATTVSAGHASWRSGLTRETVLADADRSLYGAKSLKRPARPGR